MAPRSETRATDENGSLRYRYERKFVVAGVSQAEAELIVKRHPALFFAEYPGRWVNNVYWDRIDLANVRNNLIGISDRKKTRIRWYGEFQGRVEEPVLEHKLRRGGVGRKETQRLTPFEVGAALEPARLPKMTAPGDVVLRPTLLNRYSRRYFRSANRRFRLTIDTALSYHRVGPLTTPLRSWVVDSEAILIELKYSTAYDDLATQVMSYFPFRSSRSSKYVTGMQLTDPRVRI